MKNIIIIMLSMFLLISCGGEVQEQGVIEEAVEITEGYVETLEETPAEAREVKELFDKRNDELQKELNSIR